MMCGGVAQLVEHLICIQDVAGSIPVASTTAFARAFGAVLQKRVSGEAPWRRRTGAAVRKNTPNYSLFYARKVFCYKFRDLNGSSQLWYKNE